MQKNRIQQLYRRRAATYDSELILLHLLGFWEGRYRSAAIEALKLYEHLRQKPWETMSRYFRNVSIREFYAGAIYMAAGDK